MGADNSNAQTPLASFITELYKKWRKNREKNDTKCNDNLSAFRGISTGKWKDKESEGWRSKTFINSTRQKVMTAFAIVVDIMLAGGKIPFMLKQSPSDEQQGDEIVPEEQDRIDSAIEYQENRIEEQLSDAHSDRAFAKNIMSAGLYGETFAKVAVHDVEKSRYLLTIGTEDPAIDMSKMAEKYGTYQRVKDKRTQPGWFYRSRWDIFYDLESPDDLQAGAGVFDRDFVSKHWLRGRKGRDYYIDTAIDRALTNAEKTDSGKIPEEDVKTMAPGMREVQHRQKTIRYLEFWGRVPRQAAAEFEASLQAENAGITDYAIPTLGKPEDDGDDVEVIVCVADDEIVRYIRSTPDQRPFFRAVWEDNLDDSVPNGVADNCANAQLLLNGAVRAFEDNKKCSANVETAVKEEFILTKPEKRTPGGVIKITPDCPSVQDAIMPVVTPDVGESLVSVIKLALDFLDMDSMVPKLFQGVQADYKQLAYAIAQQAQAAGKYVGSVIKNFDEGLIENIIEWLYDYNMGDPDIPVEKKGNFIVQALGFTSFQDRVERVSKIMQFLQLALSHPALEAETKVRYYLDEIAKALDVDPDQGLKTQKEKEAEAQMAAQAGAQADPETMAKIEEIKSIIMLNQAKTQTELAKVQLEQQKLQLDMEKLNIERAKVIDAASKGQPAAAPVPANA